MSCVCGSREAGRAKGVRWKRAAALVLLLCPLIVASASAQPEPRPSIGLALGGGSARGLSHVGILEWLDEHRIPVDYVAGTSMGALVGAAFATGMTPEELRVLLGNVDWDLMFLGEPPYRQREFRRKEDRRQFPVRVEAGLKDGFRLPSGLDPAHQVGLFLSHLAFPYTSELRFDTLPTPFRAVATNMDAADVQVLDHGSLAQALLATMALPGIFPVVQIDVSLFDGNNRRISSMFVTVLDIEARSNKSFRKVVDSDLPIHGARVKSIIVP